MAEIIYPYDPTGDNVSNRVSNYPVKLEVNGQRAFALVGQFFRRGFRVKFKDNPSIEMKENVDYQLLYPRDDLYDELDEPVFTIVHFFNKTLIGDWLVDMQLLGGGNVGNAAIIESMISNIASDNRDVYQENIIGFPSVLPPTGHLHHIANTYGYEQLNAILAQYLAYLKTVDQDIVSRTTQQISSINDKFNVLEELINNLDDSGVDNGQAIALKLSQITETISTLESALTNYITANNGTVSDLTQWKTTHLQTYNEFVNNYNTHVNETNNKFLAFNQTVNTVNTNFNVLTEKVNTNKTSIEQFNAELTRLSDTIKIIDNSSGGVGDAIVTMQSELDALKQQFSSFSQSTVQTLNELMTFKDSTFIDFKSQTDNRITKLTEQLALESIYQTIGGARDLKGIETTGVRLRKFRLSDDGPVTMPPIGEVDNNDCFEFIIDRNNNINVLPIFKAAAVDTTVTFMFEGDDSDMIRILKGSIVKIMKLSALSWGVYIA